MPKINMEAILSEKDAELKGLNALLDRIGKERKPVGIVCNPDDPICVKYANLKKKAFESYGFKVDLLATACGSDYAHSSSSSLMVQLPHPNEEMEIYRILYPSQDIDCLRDSSLGKAMTSDGTGNITLPATVKAVYEILKHKGKIQRGYRAVIIGKSKLVGQPLANVLMNNGISVTIFGRDEEDPEGIIKDMNPDIIVLATNSPNILDEERLYGLDTTLVVDVGSCIDEDGVYCGNYRTHSDLKDDWDYPAYTPVPGGVGPMTIRCLIENHILSHF